MISSFIAQNFAISDDSYMNQILLRTIKNHLKRHILGEKMYYHPSNDCSNHCSNPDGYYDLCIAQNRTLCRLHFCIIFNNKGLARTQIPTNKNCAPEFPTFGEIAGVNSSVVQWNCLALGELPCWSQFTPTPGKYAQVKCSKDCYFKYSQQCHWYCQISYTVKH